MFVAVGAGILWLGWNGFNGGDPYFAGSDAAAAIINTNLATAVAMMAWILMDMFFTADKKPTFLGGLNGMICGLVGITPARGVRQRPRRDHHRPGGLRRSSGSPGTPCRSTSGRSTR